MATDIINIDDGSITGTQHLGTITTRHGTTSTSIRGKDAAVGTAGHAGAFSHAANQEITPISSKYDTKFDNINNIFHIVEDTGVPTTGTFYSDGMWGLYRNTTTNDVVLAVNNSGTIETGVALS